jgi:hypothetical protein
MLIECFRKPGKGSDLMRFGTLPLRRPMRVPSVVHIHGRSDPVGVAKNPEFVSLSTQILGQDDLSRARHELLPARDFHFAASAEQDFAWNYVGGISCVPTSVLHGEVLRFVRAAVEADSAGVSNR